MANWFTRAIDKITPWDRGGEVQRRDEERKRREEEQWRNSQAQNNAPRPTQNRNQNQGPNLSVENPFPEPEKPKNIFESLNKGFVLNQPNNSRTIDGRGASVETQPAPGTIIRPSAQDPKRAIYKKPFEEYVEENRAKAKDEVTRGQSWLERNLISKGDNIRNAETLARNKATRQFREAGGDTKDISAETLRRATNNSNTTRTLNKRLGAVNVPITSTARVMTGIAQGATGLYDLITPGKGINRVSQKLNEGAERIDQIGKDSGYEGAYKAGNVVGEVGSYFIPGVGWSKLGSKVPGLTKVPTKLAKYGDDVVDAARDSSKLTRFGAGALKEALDPVNIAQDMRLNARYAGQQSGRGEDLGWRDVVENALMSLPGVVLPGLRNMRGRNLLADEAITAAGVTSKMDDVLSDADIQDILKTEINVGRDVPISAPESLPEPIRVRSNTEPKPLIQEFPGDEAFATPDALVQRNVTDARRDAAARVNSEARPDQRIEGVTPQTNEPFRLGEDAVRGSQDSLITDYADMLRNMGEKNGVDMVPTPDGGFRRVTNNIRFGDTKGKRMTKQMWRDEADRQLRSGQAEPSIQKAFDDSADPEVQSLLNKGEQTPVGEGRPITVKEAKSIPVRDETNVPQNLPETPGTVRVTEATAPNNAKSEVVAAQTSAIPVKASEVVDVDPSLPKTQADTPSKLPVDDMEFLRSINDPTQANIRQARDALKNQKKTMKTEKGFRSGEIEAARERVRAAGGSLEDQDRAVAAAMRGKFGDVEYKGSGIGDDAEQRLSDLIAKDPDLEGMGYSKENIQRAFRNLYHTGDEGYPDHIIKSDLKYIGRWLNRKVPGMGDAFEDAAKELGSLDEANLKVQIAAMPRVVQASADVGGIGRQALPLGLSNPKQFKDAIKESFKGMFNQKYYDEAIKKIERDKNFYFINDEMKVALPGVTKDWKAGEQFAASGLSEKIPVIGPIIKASQRQYDLLLTKLRYDVAAKKIEKDGGISAIIKAADESGDPKVFKQAYGDAINLLSGKSDIANLIKNNPGAMHSLFFSAPNLAYNINRLNPAYYNKLWKANPSAAKTAMTGSAIHLATVGSVIAGANQAGLVEDGKIKIGPTRYDVTGGLVTLLNTGSKMYKAATSESTGGPYEKTAADEFTNFLRNQLNPVIGTALALFDTKTKEDGNFFTDREDKFGNDYNMVTETAKSFTVPFSVQQLYEDITSGLVTPQQAAANLLAGVVGVGVNTYQNAGDKDKAAREATAGEVNPQLQSFKDSGLLSEEMVKSLPEDIQGILSEGGQLSEDELGKIKSSLVEGVGTGTGGDSDSAYRERGEYELDKAALQLKKEIIEAGPNPKPSDLKALDIQIKRSELLAESEVPFELLEMYQGTGVEEWRKMEEEDPETFQKLWAIDEMMAKSGVSYKEGNFDKQKYYQKESKSGKGGRGGRGGGRGGSRSLNLSADFGKLKAGSFAPNVKAYESIDQKSGSVPRIAVKRPNIVHKISSS
jgi:hypothetical protein